MSKHQRNVDVTDTNPTTTTRIRPPPKLEKEEVRLPVLKIERLKPGLEVELSPGNNVEDEEENNSLKLGPEGPSPPQLDKCIEDDNISMTSSSTKDDDKSYIPRSSLRRKNSATDPKRLIQSIFAKPKKEKPKKRKAAVKPKKSVKPTTQYLRVKIAPGGFGRRPTNPPAEEEESENGDGGDGDEVMDVEDADDSCDTRGVGRRLRSRGGDGRTAGGDDSEEEDDNDKQENRGGGRSRARVGDETNNDDVDSCKKSDDDDDAYRDREHEWKPVRAAMVAAMELVAKKQVTDDMRTERRIRKQISKPLPPRGRGRRAIFKRLNKPVKSYEHTTGTCVADTAYYDNTWFHKGDIVCLIQDITGPRYPDLETHRFFQINGFLKIPSMDDCVSLSLLKRVVPVPELKPRPDPPPATKTNIIQGDAPDKSQDSVENNIPEEDEEFPYRFTLMDYRPSNTGEVMVVMSQLKFVMRCPADFFYGHDILYCKPSPGRIYTRLGRDVYEYDEETISERNRRRLSNSDNENDESSSCPPSVVNNNGSNSNSNSIKGDDNESVVSSSNSNNSNINSITNSNLGESSNNLVSAK